MVLIGLLLLALICLALGLVLTSAAWLIASLIASAGAAFLLWRTGAAVAAKPAHTAPEPKADSAGDAAATAPSSAAPSNADEAIGADALTTVLPTIAADPQVWVIDGRPRYHLADCAIIKGQDAEAIPFSQATEDGFMPCSLCEPNAARTAS